MKHYPRNNNLGHLTIEFNNVMKFQDVVFTCGLSDLVYSGPLFTWWNKREIEPIGKKLDRALINGDWLNKFPHSFALFESGGISDHARCCIQLTQKIAESRRPKNFLTTSQNTLLFLILWHRYGKLQKVYSTQGQLYTGSTVR